jgi:hypothetical protein
VLPKGNACLHQAMICEKAPLPWPIVWSYTHIVNFVSGIVDKEG